MASSNGKAARSKDKVRVAIIGVGNCASSLVQGIEYYKDAKPDEFVPGLMHVVPGGYHVRDVVVHRPTARPARPQATSFWRNEWLRATEKKTAR